jgi:PhzF family phenazine biosynthesis protein
MKITIHKIAAFSDGQKGGNPAGVWIGDTLPHENVMQKIAAEIAFSETVFAAPDSDKWRVRYFSPEIEVPFCGHATIALGAALTLENGNGRFKLVTNTAEITVEGKKDGDLIMATLESPQTYSERINDGLLNNMLDLFKYTHSDLDKSIPPAIIYGGAKHLVLNLKERSKLKEMHYDLNLGRYLMNEVGLVTILLVYSQTPQLFHTRNAFASSGIYEDAATGAATAAFAGYLRDINWPHAGKITIIQGEDMGCRSILHADIFPALGSSIHISGTARIMKIET